MPVSPTLHRIVGLVGVGLLFLLSGCASRETVRPAQAPPYEVMYEPIPEAEPGGIVATGLTLMPFERFLPESPDLAKRTTWWGFFQQVQREAYTFAASPELWVPLQAIDFGVPGSKPGHWDTNGVIHLEPNVDVATLFHEVFHTVFHRSALHHGGDGKWVEAFCDAFRFAAEHEFLNPPTKWSTKIYGFSTRSYEEVLAIHKPNAWFHKYGYPASLVVKHSGGTMDGMRKLWFELISRRMHAGTDVLDDYFGYAIVEGKPLAGPKLALN